MSSNLVALYLFSIDRSQDEANDVVDRIVEEIVTDRMGIVDLVTSIGEYLTDNNISVRAKAVLLLSQTLGELPKDRLPAKHVSVLLQFYLSRLDDEVTMKENALGIGALLNMQNFPAQKIVDVCKALFSSTDMPKYAQATRLNILKVFETIIDNYLFFISSQTRDAFFSGICSTFAGEKDPRNLMLVFSMLKKILSTFPIDGFEQQFFDITYCYFPITFRAPPDATNLAITSDDLKIALRETLVANDAFSKLLLPALFERLKASTVRIKIDALNIYIEACKTWRVGAYLWSAKDFWESIKQEILNSTDAELQNLALGALNTLASKFYKEEGFSSSFTEFVDMILIQLSQRLLEDVNVKSCGSCAAVFASLASISVETFNYCSCNFLPSVLDLPMVNEPLEKQKGMLVFLEYVYKCLVLLYGKWRSKNQADIDNPLLVYKDKQLSFVSGSLMGTAKDETEIRMLALKVIFLMASIKNFLTESELTMVLQFLDDIAFDFSDPIKKKATECLKDLGLLKPDFLLLTSFPFAFSKLTDDVTAKSSSEETFKQYLSVLVSISEERSLFKALVIRLVEMLKDQFKSKEMSVDLVESIVQSLSVAFKERNDRNEQEIPFFFEELLKQLFTLCFANCESMNVRCLIYVSQTINEIVRVNHFEFQEKSVGQLWKLYMENSNSDLIETEGCEKAAERFTLAASLSDQKFLNLVVLLQGGLNGLSKKLHFIEKLNIELLNLLINVVFVTESPGVKISALRLISSLINKCEKDEDISSFISSKGVTSLWDKVYTGTPKESEAALDVLAWVDKALVSRKHSEGIPLAFKLLDTLNLQNVGDSSVKALSIIIKDDPALSKENSYVEKLLYKQRFYASVSPKILEHISTATGGEKSLYLMLLSNVIGNVPKEIVIPDMPSILPLLLQCLSLSDISVKLSTLNVIHTSVKELTSLLTEYLDTLIPSLLAIPKDMNNPTVVRLLALKCLGSLPEFTPTTNLQLFRDKVIRGLIPCLDDPKRVVRTEASRTRHKWYI
ncbi:DNA repair/transcription protein mms19 [Schizosaccharomyces pombe]